MIALDTNVIARFIVGDDHAQQRAAARLLAAAEEFFLSDLVLVEFAWVLDSVYGFSLEDTGSALEALLGRSDMVFEDEVRVRRGVRRFLAGGDFADSLIVERAQAAGCTALATFDQALRKRLPDFVIVPK